MSLERLRASLADAGLTLPLEGVTEQREAAAAAVRQIDDYIRPRLANLDAPLLAVVGGSTGSGKSTIVNALLGVATTRVGVIRPTTRQPILVHSPVDAGWFASDRILPGLARVRGRVSAPGTAASAALSGSGPSRESSTSSPPLRSAARARIDLNESMAASLNRCDHASPERSSQAGE